MFRCIALVVCFSSTLLSQQASVKQFKQGEYEAYQKVSTALTANDFQATLSSLESWKQNFPDSDYRDEREALFVQAYAGLNQPARALDIAIPLIARDVKTALPGPDGQPVALRLLYSASWAIARIPNPSAEELAAGERAAHELMAWDQPLAGVQPNKWAEAKKDMQDKASAALVYIAMLPGIQAMAKQPPDCTAAEEAYTRALGTYPDKSVLSYELGRALTCQAKDTPSKAVPAIYEFERAAVVDPTLGGVRNDPKQVQTFADNSYVRFHGSDDGLNQLKQTVRTSALPPSGFSIKSLIDLADEKNAAFESANPELALWMKIKTALLAPDGEQYFVSNLKDAAVPELRGKLVEAKPACRPRELLVTVPQQGAIDSPTAEIQLKLDKPLAGSPMPGQDFHWQGVPSAFSRDPFLLTMDAESSAIRDLKVTACTARPVRKSAPARGGR